MRTGRIRDLYIDCLKLPPAEGIRRFLSAREQFAGRGEMGLAAACLAEVILKTLGTGDMPRALLLAEQLVREHDAPHNWLLFGLLHEQASGFERSRTAYQRALASAQSDVQRMLATTCLGLERANAPVDHDDASAYAGLGEAYFEMGLTELAVLTWLAGMRRYPEDSKSVLLLVARLVVGDFPSRDPPVGDVK